MSRKRSGTRRGIRKHSTSSRAFTSRRTPREDADGTGIVDPHWKVSSVADSHELGLTAECIADIADCITRVGELSTTGRLVPAAFQRESRRISVSIRKLILSSDELLLKRCFVPRLHPLKVPKHREADVLRDWMGDMSITFSYDGLPGEREVTLPTEHTHETVVKPLFGLKRIGDNQFQLEQLCDWSASPVKYSQWLNRRVLQIDDTNLSAEQLLRMMVTREGAHSERNEMLKSTMSGPVNVTAGDAADEAYRKANSIRFGQLTYLQVFTYLVGVYLVQMMKASLKHLPQDLAISSTSRDIWQMIIDAPWGPMKQPLHLDKPYTMGAVMRNIGRPGRPFELIGDYKRISTSVVKIPGWE